MKSYDEYLKTLAIDHSPYTMKAYEFANNEFIGHFKIENETDIDKLQSNDYLEYRNHLKFDKKLSNKSVNIYMKYISAFVNWAYKFNYITKMPAIKAVGKLESPKKAIFFLTLEEEIAMVKATGTKSGKEKLDKKTMLVLMFQTGVRQGELHGIKVNDIREDGVLIYRGKELKEQVIPLTVDIRNLIIKYLSTRKVKSEYLFCNSNGKPLSSQAVGTWIKRVAKKSGINPDHAALVIPHSTRKSCASNLLCQGASMEVIQSLLGHRSIRTTETSYAEVMANTPIAKAINNQPSII